MSINTFNIPKQKTNYEGSRQDKHTRGSDIQRDEWDKQGKREQENKLARFAMEEGLAELQNSSPEELEAAATELLEEDYDEIYKTSSYSIDVEDDDSEYEVSVSYGDVFDGITSKKELERVNANNATLDPEKIEENPDFRDGFHYTDRP